MSPENPAPEPPRPSRRTVVLGSVVVLAAAVVLAVMGFTTERPIPPPPTALAAPRPLASDQLPTYSLSELRQLVHLSRP